MIAKILFTLFYPWTCATLNAAYNEYVEDLGLKHMNMFKTTEAVIVKTFMTRHVDDYMNRAFKKHWVRIVLAPHTIVTYPELYEYRIST